VLLRCKGFRDFIPSTMYIGDGLAEVLNTIERRRCRLPPFAFSLLVKNRESSRSLLIRVWGFG
jgi:hypothetical protein